MNFVDGREHGAKVVTFKDGRIVKGNVENGKMQGTWEQYLPAD